MLQARLEDGTLIVAFIGEINSSNAESVEDELKAQYRAHPCKRVELDCDRLAHATSAGLRVILRFKQAVDNTALTNVHTSLYEILDMTGFTEMMDVRKAYRVLSVEGCEVIGQGANGKVYRIDQDTVVKVYRHPDALPEIHRERELARLAFVAGLPTAIPYDVVRIEGGGYGSVFEMLNATSYAKLILRGELTPDEAAEMSIRLLKRIHSRTVRSAILPDMREIALKWAASLRDHLPAEQSDKLRALIGAVPADEHLLHGDYHIKNIMLQNGESLLIDMDTLCHGHPIFELANMYNAYVGFGLTDPDKIESFLGIPTDACAAFWRRSLELYLDTRDARRVDDVQARAKLVGLTRLMQREIRRGGLDRESGRRLIAACRAQLAGLLTRIDTLEF